jgi:hypothetical protein
LWYGGLDMSNLGRIKTENMQTKNTVLTSCFTIEECGFCSIQKIESVNKLMKYEFWFSKLSVLIHVKSIASKTIKLSVNTLSARMKIQILSDIAPLTITKWTFE